MTTKILLTIFIIGVLTGCGKDGVDSRPTLKIKSVSNDIVPLNGTLSFEFDFTDLEGDVSDTLYMKKIRLNKRITPTIRDSFKLKVPDAPSKQKGILRVELGYQNFLITGNPPGTPENDTLLFRFVLKDKANNKSDTAISEQIVIIRQ
ncbi:MAG: hypothetical protein JWQ40_1014 [Segetibacter sp.]|nr:hypothetical protein [Segetibacter sp.]